MDADGVVHEYDDQVLGEAWEGGPVLLSWFDDPDDAHGINMVIDEFAHKLDMENGAEDGIPRLQADMSRRESIAAFEPAYEDFCRRVDEADRHGRETLLDPDGSSTPPNSFRRHVRSLLRNATTAVRRIPGGVPADAPPLPPAPGGAKSAA